MFFESITLIFTQVLENQVFFYFCTHLLPLLVGLWVVPGADVGAQALQEYNFEPKVPNIAPDAPPTRDLVLR